MASEIRVNQIQNRSGLGTVTFNDAGVSIAGVTTVGILSATGNSVFSGNVTVSGTTTLNDNVTVGSGKSITVGETFIQRNAIGLGATTTTGRNAGINTAEGTVIYNSTLREVQVYKGSLGWTNIGQGFIEATGGTVSDYTDPSGIVYRAHVFTSSGTFSVTGAPASASVQTLVVAGGGGGGTYPANGAGAGGAGGLLEGTFPVNSTPGSYTITVGAGGNANAGPANGSSGSNTTIAYPSFSSTITANGGGGGSGGNSAGVSGGSGGGAGGNSLTNASATQTPYSPTLLGYGNQGGQASPIGYGGGGGGAGSAGLPGNPPTPAPTSGQAGDGRTNSYTGISTTYARGGYGSGHPLSPFTPGVNITPADAGTGNGGDGKGNPGLGGNGGSGIVVVRYQIGSLAATAKATGGLISYYGGKTIHTFTSTGTFSNTSGSPLTVEYVAIGGGGGGGAGNGGGGGGGGAGLFLNETGITVSTTPFAVTIGAGGRGSVAPGGAASSQRGNSTTVAFPSGTKTATYGGGGSNISTSVDPGGSGGGAGNASPGVSGGTSSGAPYPGTPGTTPASGWGGAGGSSSGSAPQYGAGGGGGAGGAGGNGGPGSTGDGGAGVQLPTTFRNPQSSIGAPGPGGTGYWVAGGGGGGAGYAGGAGSGPVGAGGGPGGPYAGGGNGGYGTSTNKAGSALENTGGGGGGTNTVGPPSPGVSGNGGSGIVIIAYPS